MENYETECLRCGKELTTSEDFQTGICADCWTDEDEFDIYDDMDSMVA